MDVVTCHVHACFSFSRYCYPNNILQSSISIGIYVSGTHRCSNRLFRSATNVCNSIHIAFVMEQATCSTCSISFLLFQMRLLFCCLTLFLFRSHPRPVKFECFRFSRPTESGGFFIRVVHRVDYVRLRQNEKVHNGKICKVEMV